MSRRSRKLAPAYDRDLEEAIAQSLAIEQFQKDLDEAQLNSMKNVHSQPTRATAIMPFTIPDAPPKPVSPRKSKSGFFAILFDNRSRKSRIAPDYSVPAPNLAPDPAPLDRDEPMLNFQAYKPTSKWYSIRRYDKVHPRDAGIRRSRKMRKSKRIKGIKGIKGRTRRRRH